MDGFSSRLRYLFESTRGLVLLAGALIALEVAIWGTLSGPLAQWGVKDVTVRLLGMRLVEAEREGRIVVLYHSVAIAMVAILVYLITDAVPMRPGRRAWINGTATAGYLVTMIFGLAFAYFGRNFLWHGLYVAGMALMFYAGVLLAAALWPWDRQFPARGAEYARWGRVDLERAAFFAMAVATLGSAVFGAAAGAFYGNGFETFLAENVVRDPHKSPLQLAVIGHLHIMVTLVGIATTLLVGRWFGFRGALHKWAMPLMIAGTIVVTAGVWAVVPFEPIAHTVIYVGAVPSMLAALFLVIFGWTRLIRERLAELGLRRAGLGRRLAALVNDPLRFGALWQMVFMNFTVSGVGIFMAVTLDETMRVMPAREERITLTGHWHILSVLIATIVLFYAADRWGLAGRARRWFGWVVLAGSDVAFAAVTVYSMKWLLVPEWKQQPLIDWTMLFTDAGLAAVLLVLGAFMVWRLVDLFRAKGRWRHELESEAAAGVEPPAPAVRRASAGRAMGLAVALVGGAMAAGLLAAGGLGARAASSEAPQAAWATVPAGPFLEGQFDHVADVERDFAIMVTPVTNAQFARFLEEALAAGELRIEEDWVVGPYPGDAFLGAKHEKPVPAGDHRVFPLRSEIARIREAGAAFTVQPGYEEHPATMVTWFGARAYCEFYGWRLPTGQEWEKAARGTDGRPYPWGSGIDPRRANYYASGDPFEREAGAIGDTTPVGFYDGRAVDGLVTLDSPSPYGVYDMAGNVWQWTGDVVERSHLRFLRGGSKASYGYDLRVWTRNSAEPWYASPNVGFRCARDAGH